MNKKYEFTGETMEFEGYTLKRIVFIKEFGSTMKGDLGGWIEHEGNLSHKGKCCVKDEAKVFGNARITDYAIVRDDAIVKDNVEITGQSLVTNQSIIGGDTLIRDDVWIRGISKVFLYSQVIHKNDDEQDGEGIYQPHISGDSYISGYSIIEGTGFITDSELRNVSLFGQLNMKDETIEII